MLNRLPPLRRRTDIPATNDIAGTTHSIDEMGQCDAALDCLASIQVSELDDQGVRGIQAASVLDTNKASTRSGSP